MTYSSVNQIRNLIAKDRVREALIELGKLCNGLNVNYFSDQFILLQSSYHSYQSYSIENTQSQTFLRQDISRIKKSMLSLLDLVALELKEQDASSRDSDSPQQSHSPVSSPNEVKGGDITNSSNTFQPVIGQVGGNISLSNKQINSGPTSSPGVNDEKRRPVSDFSTDANKGGLDFLSNVTLQALEERLSSLSNRQPAACLADLERLMLSVRELRKNDMVNAEDWHNLFRQTIATVIRQQEFFQIKDLLATLEEVSMVVLLKPVDKIQIATQLVKLESQSGRLAGLNPNQEFMVQEHLALIRSCYYGFG